MEDATAVTAAQETSTTIPPFEDFFAHNRDRLFSAMCLVTRNRGEAEDITQDAFVRVLERWDRVGGLNDPEGYLYRTAMNTFRRGYRRRLLAARRAMKTETAPDPLDEVEVHDTAIRALSTLSERQRAVLVLTDLLGYSSEETARMLGIRASTVRAHASIARAALRSTMGQEL